MIAIEQIELKKKAGRMVPIEENFAEDIFANTDEDVIRYLPLLKPPRNTHETLQLIRTAKLQNETGTSLILAVLGKEDEFIGLSSLEGIREKRPAIGLWIKKAAWGQGYGTAIVDALIDWAYGTLFIRQLKYPVARQNYRSIHIIEKLGGVLRKEYLINSPKRLEVMEYWLDIKK